VGRESAAVLREYTHLTTDDLRAAMQRLPDVTMHETEFPMNDDELASHSGGGGVILRKRCAMRSQSRCAQPMSRLRTAVTRSPPPLAPSAAPVQPRPTHAHASRLLLPLQRTRTADVGFLNFHSFLLKNFRWR
jgi:hypothetical protein